MRHASRGHGGVGPVLAIPETAFPVRRLMPLYSPILAGDPVLANALWTSTLCVPLSIQRLAGLTRVRGRFLMRGLGTGACGGLPAQLPIVDDGAARTSPSTGGVVVGGSGPLS